MVWIENSVSRVTDIGVGRFRLLGGQGLEYWGGKGAKFPAGTSPRNDVNAT